MIPKKSSVALALLKHSSKAAQDHLSTHENNNHLTKDNPLHSSHHSKHSFQSNHSNDKDTYFNTSESDCDYYLALDQTIIEKTPDNSYGRFDELLGSGSHKQVYRGYDFNQGREIAWSIINPSHQNIDKITEEIKILNQLNHPNIIHFITGWLNEKKNQVIIITELVSGGSLRNNLKRIKSPRLRLVKKWIREILEGLNYLHKKNIIHRDIKCDNIFLDSISGNVKIGDLGGSEVIHKKYATQYVGTEEFMAPEVHEGKYTTKADIYSLGISIIEMLTMEKPYKECDGPMTIYYNITHGIFPECLSKIDNENIVKFIKKCLLRENERPSAEDLLTMNDFLSDMTSEENDYPVKIVNKLRLENIIPKKDYEKNELPIIVSDMKKKRDITTTTPVAKEEKELLVNNEGNGKSLTKLELSSSEYRVSSFTNTNSNNLPISSPTKAATAHIRNNIKKSTTSSTSSFVITIKESSTQDNFKYISAAENNNSDSNYAYLSKYHSSSNNSNNNNNTLNDLEISFVISKETWKNKKLLKCPYSLNNDTADGLASELQKAIDLDDNEYQIVRDKLNESINQYTSSSALSSHRTSLNKYDEFQSSYNNLIEHLKALINNKKTKQFEQLLKDNNAIGINIGNNYNENAEMHLTFERQKKFINSFIHYQIPKNQKEKIVDN